MEIIKLSDENFKKCAALKVVGIIVNNRKYGNKTIYNITLNDNPKADMCIETSFTSINDILIAFKDRLCSNKIMIKTA